MKVETAVEAHLQVDEPGLVRGDLVHRVDLVGDGRDVFSGVGFSADVELVGGPQVWEEGEELLQGVVQVWENN